jgi:uncharacterized protein with HEPN domain
MSNQRDSTDYLRDILEYISYAQSFIADMSYEQFAQDRKTQLAVTQTITIIGEAANKIPIQVREQFSEIPWRDIINMRNRLIHSYDMTVWQLVWNVVIYDMPFLKNQIESMLFSIIEEQEKDTEN